jgi:hypothetical protein
MQLTEEELIFWKQVYCAALTASRIDGYGDEAVSVANEGVEHLRLKRAQGAANTGVPDRERVFTITLPGDVLATVLQTLGEAGEVNAQDAIRDGMKEVDTTA